MKIRILLAIFTCFSAVSGSAQLLQWNTFSNTGLETTEASVYNDPNLASSALTFGSGITPSGNENRYGGSNWFNTGNSNPSTLGNAVVGNDYIQFIVTPNTDYTFTPTSLVFTWQSSSTGPNYVTLRSSNDAYVADLGSVTTSESLTQHTLTITGLNNLWTTTFRLYGHGASATGGTGGFDIGSNIVNVQLNGTVSSQAFTTQSDGPWTTNSTWIGNVAPGNSDNVIINHNISVGSITRNAGTTTIINIGGKLEANLTYTNNGSTTINGSFQLNQGSWATGSNFVYGSSGTLIFNNSSGSYGINNTDAFWPAANGPVNVTVMNAGGINLGVPVTASRTVSGLFQTSAGVNLSNSSVLTLTGTAQLNSGGNFGSTPVYGSNSTLIYNHGGTFVVSNEWTGNSTTAGVGVPKNLTIQNNTTLTMPGANRGIAGNLNISSGSLPLNAAGDLYVAGNWNRASGSVFTPNSKAVFFNGSSTQVISSGSGSETFNYLLIQGSGTVQLATGTDVLVTGNGGLTLASSNATSTLDLNGRTLTVYGGGDLNLSSGNRKISSSVAGGKLVINTAAVTVTNGGALQTDTNTTIDLQHGLNAGTGSLLTVNGILQINDGGYCFGNSPRYGSTALLQYNSGTNPYSRQLEWTSASGTIGAIGLPANVRVSNNTTLNYINGANSGPKGIMGNLTIDSGSSFFMDYGSVSCGGALVISGNLVNAGNMTLGFAMGDDLQIAGNISFSSGYSFDAKTRAVIFTKAATQTISASSTPTFHYLNMTSGSTVVQLSGTSLNITAPAGGNVISFSTGSVLDLNGNTLTLGSTGLASQISGSGTFKGSSTSNMTLLGNGSIGTLSFTSGSQILGTLTVNRQAAATAFQLGSGLTVNNTLGLTNGIADLNGNVLTMAASATISGGSANSYVFANANNSELRKVFTDAGTFTYPVGDNTSGNDYSPATIAFSGGSFNSSSFAGVQVRDGKHPNNIAPSHYLSRYWKVTSSGITGAIAYSFTGTYTSGDINGTEANSKPGRYDGSNWTNIGATSISSNTLSVTALNTLPAVNDFSAGDPLSDAAYYFRSSANGGSWGTATSWQVSPDNSTGWATATAAPGTTASGITIRNGFNINSSGAVSCDDLTIESGATLSITGGTFTVSNGPGATDLQINGTLNYNSGNFIAAGSISAGPLAVYNHAVPTSVLSLPAVTWHPTSTCNITGMNNTGPVNAVNMGQAFGNLNWNNGNQGSYVNIGSSLFSVAGTLTVGPNTNTDNKLSMANNSGTYNNTINKLVVSGGQFNGNGNSGTVNLTITEGATISGGIFAVSDGSGIANVNIGSDLTLSGTGQLWVIANSGSPTTTLNIGRDLTLSGTAAVNLEQTSATSGTATINIVRDFSSSSTSVRSVDFGTGTVSGNAINIGRHFTKSGIGKFYTSSASAATGFAFNGSGSQQLSYSGTTSEYTSYVVKAGSTLSLSSNHTIGRFVNPASSFTVENGGTLDFGANSIIAENNTDPNFAAASGATLITSNPNGFGGTSATGSLNSFGSSKITLPLGVNYTVNSHTSAPFPNIVFGNVGTLTINAHVTSNLTSVLTIEDAMVISNSASFKPLAHNINLNSASFTIASGGVYDNNGENALTGSGNIDIYGRFITRDQEGFMGTNTSITAITPTLSAGSVVEFGRAGDQVVQGNAPDFKGIHLSGSGTKTLTSANLVSEAIVISDSAILKVQDNAFGGSGVSLTMTGTSRYVTGGVGVRPTAAGTYSLGAATTIEFTNTEATLQTPRLNKTYANIDVSGTNFGIGSAVNGIMFQPNSTFKVKSGATFKLHNTSGFTGTSSSAIESGNPTIVLETGSTIDYAGADQTLTPSTPAYYNLRLSGTGTKSILSASEVLVDHDLDLTTATLKIDSNKLLTVTNAINNSSTPILIENGGNLVQINDGAVDTGNIKLTRTSRYMDHDDYIYWGAPIQENMVSQFVNMDASYMWELTGALDGYWAGITTTAPGRGYITRLGEAAVGIHDYYFTGTPNNGIIHVAADSYDNGATEASGNAVLLGNPYPCAIDAAAFILENADSIEGTLYFWTAKTPMENNQYTADDYASWNYTGSTGTVALTDTSGTDDLKPSGMIGAGQGFFATLNSDLGITFNNAMRLRTTADNMQFFRPSNQIESSERHRIWINIKNELGGFRQMLLGYVTGATNGYDSHYDGKTFTSNSLNIYSVAASGSYVIQGRALPFTTADTVPVGYSAAAAGSHTISIDDMDGIFDAGQQVYLEDLDLSIIHNLSLAPYTFTTLPGTFNNRFLIRYTDAALGMAAPEPATQLIVTASNQQIAIRAAGNLIQEVSLFDVRGRMIDNETNIKKEDYMSPSVLHTQALIVKVMLVDGSWHTRKVLVK